MYVSHQSLLGYLVRDCLRFDVNLAVFEAEPFCFGAHRRVAR
jgi:hypothetical protein